MIRPAWLRRAIRRESAAVVASLFRAGGTRDGGYLRRLRALC